MTVFVGGYYKDEDTKVFDDIKIYDLEEALNLPFVGYDGLEDFYDECYKNPPSNDYYKKQPFIEGAYEGLEFYELSDEMLAKLIIRYVENDELATLYAFNSTEEAEKFIEEYKYINDIDVEEEIIKEDETENQEIFEKVNKALIDTTENSYNWVCLTRNVDGSHTGKYALENIITHNISRKSYETLDEVIEEFELDINAEEEKNKKSKKTNKTNVER